MTGNRRFVSIGDGHDHDHEDTDLSEAVAPRILPHDDDPADGSMEWVEYEPPFAPPRRPLVPALALLALVVWTGAFLWAHFAALSAGSTSAQGLALIEAWSSPVALLGIVWLLLQQRAAPAESDNFLDKAQTLASEAALLETRLGAVNAELSIARDFIAAQSRDLESLGRLAAERLSQNAERLASLISDNGAQLEAIGAVSTAALDNMERLRGQLPVISSAAKDATSHIGNAGRIAQEQLTDLVAAIGEGETRLAGFDARVTTLRDTLAEANASGEALSRHVGSSNEQAHKAMGEISAFHHDLEQRSISHASLLDGMRQSLGALDRESVALVEKANTELTRAIASLHDAARSAGSAIREEGGEAVAEIAQQLGEESIAAIERALRNEAAALTGRLEQSAAHAAGVAREAGDQLREEVARVDALVASLETRVADARAKAQEQVDNGFARRAALITEALNSNAIEIAKALDGSVSDTAWASYLKGDRGIFTRQAVRLLSAGEGKSIAKLYHNDDDFRERVSHYIADFESMLREILSTRDGESLGVTLLSSDMGKLYVALAQAIERLRS